VQKDEIAFDPLFPKRRHIRNATRNEYSRNPIFEVGGRMDQVFQALIDRSRVLLDLKTITTIHRGPQLCRSVLHCRPHAGTTPSSSRVGKT
jgi:hypothetical protein